MFVFLDYVISHSHSGFFLFVSIYSLNEVIYEKTAGSMVSYFELKLNEELKLLSAILELLVGKMC